MIVVRFKVTCKPDVIEQAKALFAAAIAPSRQIEGVINFDIAQDLADSNSLIATEVFEDEAALARQEDQAVVKDILTQLPNMLAAEPEATVYQVASSRPWE